MPDSERITWEPCPHCHQPAAVGWWHDRPVEFDCPEGCVVSPEQVGTPATNVSGQYL